MGVNRWLHVLPLLVAFALFVVPSIPVVRAETMQPDQDVQVAPSSVWGFQKLTSSDDRVSVSAMSVYRGGAAGVLGMILTVFDGGEPEGDYQNNTTFEIPGPLSDTPDNLKLERLSETNYRFSYDAKLIEHNPQTTLWDQRSETFVFDIFLKPSGDLARLERSKNRPEDGRKYSSYWNHNGSVMGLVAEGDRRSFYYTEPRNGLPVAPGTLLFSGITKEGRYSGTAYRFMSGFEPIGYPVSGPVQNDGTKVTMKGLAPVRNGQGKIVRHVDDVLVFTYKSK